jgi:hypothetical protein
MSVWEVTNKWMNSVASYVRTPEDMNDPNFRKQFGKGGAPLKWNKRPRFTLKVEKGNKQPKPRADINTINAPGLVLNAKARDVLGDFLTQFGQLLEVEVDGQVEYYYNVTQVIPGLDHQQSKIDVGYVDKAVFKKSAIPSEPVVFVDPAVVSRIFVNDAAKAELEARIAKHNIIGMSFAQRECSH